VDPVEPSAPAPDDASAAGSSAAAPGGPSAAAPAAPPPAPAVVEAVGEDRPLVVIDASAADREEAELLEEALGRPVTGVEPVRLGRAAFEEIGNAAAVVIAWDLGGASGIDLLDALLRDERTRALPIALASAAPTRPMVCAALRAGAASFVRKPYTVEELVRRFGPGLRVACEDAEPPPSDTP
jgi:CheY-like chemotaxis protein